MSTPPCGGHHRNHRSSDRSRPPVCPLRVRPGGGAPTHISMEGTPSGVVPRLGYISCTYSAAASRHNGDFGPPPGRHSRMHVPWRQLTATDDMPTRGRASAVPLKDQTTRNLAERNGHQTIRGSQHRRLSQRHPPGSCVSRATLRSGQSVMSVSQPVRKLGGVPSVVTRSGAWSSPSRAVLGTARWWDASVRTVAGS